MNASTHPRGLYTLFFTEMWERLSYYGMRALLVLFMVAEVRRGGLGLTDEIATAIYGLYTAGVYLSALPGGWIADRLLGAQRAVWVGGILIAIGHFTLLLPLVETFFLGLLFNLLVVLDIEQSGRLIVQGSAILMAGAVYSRTLARR